MKDQKTDQGPDKGRRRFIQSAVVMGVSGGVAGAIAGGVAEKVADAMDRDTRTTLSYPPKRLSSHAELQSKGSVAFHYPDNASPCLLIKTGRECALGIGPERDIVAYSVLCTHQGCPVAYDADQRNFRCPCHFSLFDGEKAGQVICGQATRDLTRIELAWDPKTGEISAVGVAGLIYGRQANLL